jgi:SpoOM protein
MSILDGVKRTLNISGSDFDLVTEKNDYFPGDIIKGRITITTPEYRLTGDSIQITLSEFWVEARSAGKTTTVVTVHKNHKKETLEEAFDFEAKSRHIYSFEIKIPESCRISTKATGWCLIINMSIPMAIDQKKRIVLKINPAVELLGILDACEQKPGFVEILKYRNWNPKTSKVYFRLMPPADLKSEFDYLAFEMLKTGEGGVEGEIIFNLQEKSLCDYLRAITGKDKIRVNFNFTKQQIFSEDGVFKTEEISRLIEAFMKEVIARH